MTYQIVKHAQSGEQYAARIEDDGTIYMTGALHYSEVDADFADYEFDNDETEFYNANDWQVVRSA